MRLRSRGALACALVIGLGASSTLSADAAESQEQRPRIGVAFGGGSARGLAHVGVLRWFDEHRIPVDLAAGTSMGGLIGGAFASGMSPSELSTLLANTDWDAMFGSSAFEYKNIRRKRDARDYPSHIEFGLKRGFSLPTAINDGQEVENLLGRITAPYYALEHFDNLPTPFRSVAVDLRTARIVVLDHGSLAQALRATMSLPGIFPPVEIGDYLLVDGGAMNNVPADVVRQMGADVVIAVNVGAAADPRMINQSLLAIMGSTVDAMMRAGTRTALESADLIITPPLKGFRSLDWRRSRDLADDGYQAAEVMRDKLLPYALDEADWQAYLSARDARRRTELPPPQSLTFSGVASSDESLMKTQLQPYVGRPIDIPSLERTLARFKGLDRYQTVTWTLAKMSESVILQINAKSKTYAPPFLMSAVTLENTSSEEFRFRLAARYLAFDLVGSGSELRIDGAVGARPSLGAELYRPITRTPMFVAFAAGTMGERLSLFVEDRAIAEYDQRRSSVGADAGVNLGRVSDVRGGVRWGRMSNTLHSGNPLLPDVSGQTSEARLQWQFDDQDSPVVPSRGAHVTARLRHILQAPDVPSSFPTDRTNDDVTQAEVNGSQAWSMGRRNVLFVAGGAGTSFDGHPLADEQFALGAPLRLGAFDTGEIRGDHFILLTTAYLRVVGRLPDLLGGNVYLGGWIENGSAFDDFDTAKVYTHFSGGAIVDTLMGPMLVAGSAAVDGRWRFYVSIGSLLR
jgi:NTE family protein